MELVLDSSDIQAIFYLTWMDAVCTACGTTVRSSRLVAHPEPASLGMAPEDRLRQPGPCVFRSFRPSRRLGLDPSQLASYKHGWVSSIDVREKVRTPGMHIQPVLSFGQCLLGRGLSTPPLRYIRLFVCLFGWQACLQPPSGEADLWVVRRLVENHTAGFIVLLLVLKTACPGGHVDQSHVVSKRSKGD